MGCQILRFMEGFLGDGKGWLLPVCGCVERGWIALDECASREAVGERGILDAEILLDLGGLFVALDRADCRVLEGDCFWRHIEA